MILSVVLLCLPALLPVAPRSETLIHSVCDISQEFSFYMDGRFHTQYLAQHGRDARNWGTLSKLDLDNTNLLVLTAGDRRIPYAPASLTMIDEFLRKGGTTLLMVDGAQDMPPAEALVEAYGAQLSTKRPKAPLSGTAALTELCLEEAGAIEFRGGTTLRCTSPWRTLVKDRNGDPMLALRSVDSGHLLIGSRSLFGHKPDASDPINAAWIQPLLLNLAKSKAVDTTRAHHSTRAELSEQLGALTLEYTEGTRPFAHAIAGEYAAARPHLVALTGVEPAPGMIKKLLILPTGGGGFSSGARIAIGAWWGNYPENRYAMVELIAHEAGHSWVLPHPEPLWNEPIATYLGIRVGQRLGLSEAEATLERQLKSGRRHDPDFNKVNPLAADAARDLIWGKSYFVFEELERLHGPGALVKYFRAKRRMLSRDRPAYTFDDCVAVWSEAVGGNMFRWFANYGFDVDHARTDLFPADH
ncbi:MAG: hypothetical protein ACI835_000047 [Planctomycetota bacterium]|jgi:hypothetical protein